MAETPRVPLRRLSTARFKTLAARNEDNARRRARSSADRQGIPWESVKENIRQSGTLRIPWSGVALSVKNPATYDRALAVAAQTRRNAAIWQRDPTSPVPGAADEWDDRDDDLPEELYYYHGIYG
jgi:hypothetical protein